jgi:uncharacterized protein YdaU (DUF1376 family)
MGSVGERGVKLPFIQFFPADYLRDTRALSLAAKGGWTDILCMLHGAQNRGTMTLPMIGWARVMGASVDQAEAVIAELGQMKTAEVERLGNGDVTVTCRRMLRERITREQTRLRVERHRRNARTSARCNGAETGQKTETRDQETSSPPPKSGEPPSEGQRFVLWFIELLQVTGATPRLTPAVKDNWADCYEKLIRLDGRTKDEVKAVCRWAREDAFWRKNFLSPMKLREKKDGVPYFDLFLAKMSDTTSRNGSAAKVPDEFRLKDTTKEQL